MGPLLPGGCCQIGGTHHSKDVSRLNRLERVSKSGGWRRCFGGPGWHGKDELTGYGKDLDIAERLILGFALHLMGPV